MNELFYGQFYGFDSPPFNTTPDASLLFPTETHHQALGAIEYGIASGKGFIVITGEVGVGKTTILRTCIDRLDSSKIKTIYVFDPSLRPLALYQTLLDELDGSARAGRGALPSSPHRLHHALLAAHTDGYQVILAIDEAQNMPEETLEAVRILSNFETSSSKLLQIVMVGQPELDHVLAKHSMRQLTQRIAVRARIRPLTWRQSCRYIVHRLQSAGRTTDRPLFTLPALWYVALKSGGIPRSINILCDNALINGYGENAQRLSLRIVRDSYRCLLPHSGLRQARRLAAVMVTIALIVLAGVFGGGLGGKPSTSRDRENRAASAIFTSEPAPGRDGLVARAEAAAHVNAAAVEVSDVYGNDVAAHQETSPPITQQEPEYGDGSAVVAAMAKTDSRSVEPPIARDQHTSWKWLVRSGDTVTKVCRVIYGQCDQETLQAIYKSNSQIGTDRLLRVGETIIMPERVAAGVSQ